MNIVEAVKAAQERGLATIARDYAGGFELIRPTNTYSHIERASYPDGATGAIIFRNYSLNLSELLSKGWYLPDMLPSEYNDAPDIDGIEFDPVEYDPEIKELHGYKVGDIVTLVPTGDELYILGFNPKNPKFDIAAMFFSERPDGYVCAEDIKLLKPADESISVEPPALPTPSAALISKQEADNLVALATSNFNEAFLKPAQSAAFKDLIRISTEQELQIAEIYLVDKRDHGEKVKTRLDAVVHELKIRQRGHKKTSVKQKQR